MTRFASRFNGPDWPAITMRLFVGRMLPAILICLAAAPVAAAVSESEFVNWENHPTHGLDISPDGNTLAVINMPDNRVEFFNLAAGFPSLTFSVPVGLDPVSVRFRNDGEAWVVNHISDTISVIDIATRQVASTIQTLDEPYDLVFAASPVRAYVSCSQVDTIQVFDPATRLETDTIAILGEDPRSMAVSVDGLTVFVAIFESGNRSTSLGGGAAGGLGVPPNVVTNAGPYGGQNPPYDNDAMMTFDPPINVSLATPPKVGLIVKQDGAGVWRDFRNSDWSQWVDGADAGMSARPVGWTLIDNDLAIIDTSTNGVTYAGGLMNICMAIGVNPATGNVTVVGIDARNEVRFEPNITGKFTEVYMGIVDPSAPSPTSRVDLNPHLVALGTDSRGLYAQSTIAQSERDKSVGDPREIVWNAAGDTGYIVGMGSNNVIVIDAAGARKGAEQIDVGEGPTDLALDESRNRLYVLNRFAGSLSVISTVTEQLAFTTFLHDATPVSIKTGRKHLYNTHKNSGLGQISCASCHVDARMDRLAWDLGDPSGTLKPITNVLTSGQHNLGANVPFLNVGFDAGFHPMKGPMTTQTFQDIIGHEPLHWRGDRDGIEEFSGAFIGLQGDDTTLTMSEMQEFEDFVDTVTFPPNPNRNFDNTLSTNVDLSGHFAPGNFSLAEGAPLPNGDATHGLEMYRGVGSESGRKLDNPFSCSTCHTVPTGMGTDMTWTGSMFVPLPLGPLGEAHHQMVSVDQSTQKAIKTPQIRNQFDKEGFNYATTVSRAGFGVLHDGSIDGVARFLSEPVFSLATDQELADIVALVMSFSGSDFAPSSSSDVFDPPGPPSQDTHAGCGRQVTITDANPVTGLFGLGGDVITAMIAQAEVADAGSNPRVDLVVKGSPGSEAQGWVYDSGSGSFQSDRQATTLTVAALRALASVSNPLTYTLVPRGSGQRIGVDRDGDTFFDNDENDAGSDPADPNSTPLSVLGAIGWGRYM